MPLTITPFVAVVVLGAAVLHAVWNAAAKAIPDRLLASALIGVGFSVVGITGLLLAPTPDAASWPYVVVGGLLQTAYLLTLTSAYAHGEFSRVYPIARGTAPLLVLLFSLVVLGEQLSAGQIAGIIAVVGALTILAFTQSGNGRARTSPRGFFFAIVTGVIIAAYSLVDGTGVRLADSVLGYASWSFSVHGPTLIIVSTLLAGRARTAGWFTPDKVGASPWPRIALGIAGGVLALTVYGIVLWAQSQASLSLVSALRETSVIFGAVIGLIVFKERMTGGKAAAVIAIVAGIALMQLA